MGQNTIDFEKIEKEIYDNMSRSYLCDDDTKKIYWKHGFVFC